MNFKPDWSDETKISLLQRWILVQSYIYYELNENVSSDFEYDDNVKQLFRLIEENPDAFYCSRYYLYFKEYEPGCTSGFELLEKVRKKDDRLFRHLGIDATLALDTKAALAQNTIH